MIDDVFSAFWQLVFYGTCVVVVIGVVWALILLTNIESHLKDMSHWQRLDGQEKEKEKADLRVAAQRERAANLRRAGHYVPPTSYEPPAIREARERNAQATSEAMAEAHHNIEWKDDN